jgi:MYXO-CTERM domain-containing protein
MRRFVVALGVAWAAALAARSTNAAAAPIKVACVGEQTTHSDQLNRDVEYPAMLEKMLGSCYDVENFGDCCATVVHEYPMQSETHPYLEPPARFAPAFHESITFAPDIVVIGSWGKHDTEIAGDLDGGKLDPVQWQTDYEQLVTTYLNLPNRPLVFVSTPLPLPKGAGTGPVTELILPAIQNIATKYHLPVVPLYAAFLNQTALYKDDTHPTDTTGLQTIADAVYAAMTTTVGTCGDGGLVAPAADAGSEGDAAETAPAQDEASASGPDGGGDGADGGPGVGIADAGASSGRDAAGEGAPATAGCSCRVASESGDSVGSGAMAVLGTLAGCLLIRRRAI